MDWSRKIFTSNPCLSVALPRSPRVFVRLSIPDPPSEKTRWPRARQTLVEMHACVSAKCPCHVAGLQERVNGI